MTGTTYVQISINKSTTLLNNLPCFILFLYLVSSHLTVEFSCSLQINNEYWSLVVYVNIVQVVCFLIVQGFYQQSAYNPHQKSLKHLCTSLVRGYNNITKGRGERKVAKFSKVFQVICPRV